jgi:hypothetical protein
MAFHKNFLGLPETITVAKIIKTRDLEPAAKCEAHLLCNFVTSI